MSKKESKTIRQHSAPNLKISDKQTQKYPSEIYERISLDGDRILIIFHVISQFEDQFERTFKKYLTISEVKTKLTKLLQTTFDNIILSKGTEAILDKVRIAEIETDTSDNIHLNIKMKDDAKIDVVKIKKFIVNLIAISTKPEPFNVTCKFNVVNQKHIFTQSFMSTKSIESIKAELGALLTIDKALLIIKKDKKILPDYRLLSELKIDSFGNLEVELYTKHGTKLRLDTIYKDLLTTDILTVAVPTGPGTFKTVNVEVVDVRITKPYLGGFHNKKTGLDYHHAFSQTPPKKPKLPPEMQANRDTQTAFIRTKAVDTCTTRGTQMTSKGAYIPNITDRILPVGRYVSYDEMMAALRLDERATVIQRAWRAYRYRCAVYSWLQQCMDRITYLKEQEENDHREQELRWRQEIVAKAFPRTREDFDQLYAMVDRWRNSEISRISKLHTKGPKVAEFCLLLDKEIQLLRSIEKFRIELKEDNRKVKEKKLLEEICKPVVWKDANGKLISMDTLEAQQARQLKELYFAFCRDDLPVEERMKLLVNFKFTLQFFNSNLSEELTKLLDRECELMIRNVSKDNLEVLRKRILTTLYQLIKCPEFNGGSMRRSDLLKLRKMRNHRLFYCRQCDTVKLYTEFPLHCRTKGMNICTSCTWSSSEDQNWVDMTPYKFILRSIRREERKNRSPSSVVFILQEKDIYFIIEKIWHSQSALSESTNVADFRLARWKNDEDWAPWNCILLTYQETRVHLQLPNLENVYDDDLIETVKTKHLLARSHFKELIDENKFEDINVSDL